MDLAPRILAAEDDRVVRRMLEANLTRWGYTPVLAATGTEAWEILLQPDAPRLVILDWMMPGIDGLEICRRLRERKDRGYTHVLLLTGRRDEADLISAFEAGADDYLTKPFNSRELQLRLAAGARRLGAARAAGPPGPSASPGPMPALRTPNPCDASMVGATVGGKYCLVEPIAAGAMGTVWRGVHRALGTRVAIKFIRPEYALHPGATARFETEARASSRLQSRHVVRVYDYGVTDDRLPYLVMEYLDGCSLADAVEDRGALPPEEAVAIISQAARALALVHAAGIVHRDIKPENIMLVRDPDAGTDALPYTVKVVDFGLARFLEAPRGVPSNDDDPTRPFRPLTLDGSLCGTPNYMSPEILLGDSDASGAQDLWALAASGFEALTGRIAFEGEAIGEIVESVCGCPPPVPSSVNPALSTALDAWFSRACHTDPAMRFRGTAEFLAALEATLRPATAAAAAPPPEPRPLPRSLPLPVPLRRSVPTLAWTVGLSVAFGLIALAGWIR